jgi:hypothetical protein
MFWLCFSTETFETDLLVPIHQIGVNRIRKRLQQKAVGKSASWVNQQSVPTFYSAFLLQTFHKTIPYMPKIQIIFYPNIEWLFWEVVYTSPHNNSLYTITHVVYLNTLPRVGSVKIKCEHVFFNALTSTRPKRFCKTCQRKIHIARKCFDRSIKV